MPSFATVAELVTYMNRTFAVGAETDRAQQALDVATSIIQNYTRQRIERVAGETAILRRTYGTIALLPELPVEAVTSVTDDTGTLVVDTDYEVREGGVLRRLVGTWRYDLTVVYTHGYATIPNDIKGVTLQLAESWHGHGGRDVESEALGTYRVFFAAADQWAGARTVLDRYRITKVPVTV